MKYNPLPRRVIPKPWEDLASLISRAARRMGYQDPRWLLCPEQSSLRVEPKRLAYLIRCEDYALLEQRLLLDEETLYSLTLHRFILSLGKAPLPLGFQPSDIQRPQIDNWHQTFWSPLETQICPQCLDEEESYDRLYWRVRALLICPQHLVYLQHRCPSCQAPIPALRPSPLQCPHCRTGDYRLGGQAVVSEGAWLYDTQMLLLEHLGVSSAQQNVSFPIQSLLKRLPAREYFVILRQFEELFTKQSFGEIILSQLSQAPGLQSLRTRPGEHKGTFLLHWIVADWPHHFFWLLEQMRTLAPEEYRLGEEGYGWAKAPSSWQEKTFFKNSAFFARDQQETYSLIWDFFHNYDSYFPSIRGSFSPWGLSFTSESQERTNTSEASSTPHEAE